MFFEFEVIHFGGVKVWGGLVLINLGWHILLLSSELLSLHAISVIIIATIL